MVARTESSSVLRRGNWYARLSVVLGVVTLAVGPVALYLSKRSTKVSLLQAVAAIAASGVLALVTLLLARRARLKTERTLGRVGGTGLTRLGRLLGLLELCIAVAAGIALAFYALLQAFIA